MQCLKNECPVERSQGKAREAEAKIRSRAIEFELEKEKQNREQGTVWSLKLAFLGEPDSGSSC